MCSRIAVQKLHPVTNELTPFDITFFLLSLTVWILNWEIAHKFKLKNGKFYIFSTLKRSKTQSLSVHFLNEFIKKVRHCFQKQQLSFFLFLLHGLGVWKMQLLHDKLMSWRIYFCLFFHHWQIHICCGACYLLKMLMKYKWNYLRYFGRPNHIPSSICELCRKCYRSFLEFYVWQLLTKKLCVYV